MQKYFTQYWTNERWELETAINESGYTALDHTAGNQFSTSGVSKKDVIFIVTVKKGLLYLGGKIIVEKACGQKEAQRILKPGFSLYPAKEHIISTIEFSDFSPRLQVPVKIVEKLYFEGPDGPKPPKFKMPGILDQQTLRGVRRLTGKSAEELLKLL